VEPLLYAQWTQPDMPVEANPNVLSLASSQMLAPGMGNLMGAPGMARRGGVVMMPSPGKERRIVLEQTGGHVWQEIRPREGATEEETFTFLLPPVLHPLVAGEAVIVREADNIVAYDIASGALLWASHNFPLYRPTSVPPGGYYMGPVGQNYTERLEFAISAGEGRIYAVGLGLPPFLRFVAQRSANRNHIETASSALAAFSIPDQGRLLWQVGRGQGENDLLQQADYLPGPVYRDGRVYALAEQAQNLYALALAADTGRLLWSSRVCSLPSSQNWPDVESRFRPAGPVVAQGRVFVATSAGVVAAYDADAG
jgi:outer membrane protein assembly factor BamB